MAASRRRETSSRRRRHDARPCDAHPVDPFADLHATQAIIAAADLRYTDEVMGRAPELRVISRIGVGCDNIDLVSASQRGIVVCNAPDAPTNSTAEHAIALVLAVAKGIPSAQSLLRRFHIRFAKYRTCLQRQQSESLQIQTTQNKVVVLNRTKPGIGDYGRGVNVDLNGRIDGVDQTLRNVDLFVPGIGSSCRAVT